MDGGYRPWLARASTDFGSLCGHWLRALWTIATERLSACELQRRMGLGSYRTAWLLMCGIRESMAIVESSPLRGRYSVEGLEPEHWHSFVPVQLRPPLMLWVSAGSPESGGKTRMRFVPRDSRYTIQDFLREAVEENSDIETAAGSPYPTFDPKTTFYRLRVLPVDSSPPPVMPAVRHVCQAFAEWLSAGPRSLLPAMDVSVCASEFMFRRNNSDVPPPRLFYLLVKTALADRGSRSLVRT